MKFSLVVFSLLLTGSGLAQSSLDNIDLKKIPQEKIRALIHKELTINNIHEFSGLEPTYRKGQNLRGYRYLESCYLVKENPKSVWETYLITSPAKSWNGRMVSFGLLVSKWKKQVLYRDDQLFAGIDTGQVFYVNLRILGGLYNLAVGLEIVEVDSLSKTICFSYIRGGKSKGEQMIRFVPTRKGYTQIIHTTVFRSNSFLRDRYLYPYFHRIAINEFHRNMRKNMQLNHDEMEAYIQRTPAGSLP